MPAMPRSDRSPRRRLAPDERRGAILAAAAEEFAVAPYDAVSVATVAARAQASEALVYRYFDGKADLYAHVLRAAVADLLARQAAALAELPAGVPVRDRLRATTLVYLDHVASHPTGWASPLRAGAEPEVAVGIRREARADYVARLAALLAPSDTRRHEYALWGWFGFLDAACLRWVDRGCPADDRWSLLDVALGALEGALGDWAA
jgi:AcrR family transcriptional regulator